jgi:cytochrome d ubiquinol oxidase subunit I
VNVVRLAYQTMIAAGTAMALLGLGYLALWWRRRRLPRSRWFYRAVIAAGPLSVVALVAGWTTTEVGRQPWIVFERMRTADAVTSAKGLPVAYVLLVLVYAALAAAVVWLLRRIGRQALEEAAPSDVRVPVAT